MFVIYDILPYAIGNVWCKWPAFMCNVLRVSLRRYSIFSLFFEYVSHELARIVHALSDVVGGCATVVTVCHGFIVVYLVSYTETYSCGHVIEPTPSSCFRC